MASDSRLTLNAEEKKPGHVVIHMAVGMSDTNYKTFLVKNRIGISTVGAAAVENEPIAGYLEAFTVDHLSTDDPDPDDVAKKLCAYLRGMPKPPDTAFHVAGYGTQGEERVQRVWHVGIARNDVKLLNTAGPSAWWAGEGDILARLIMPMASLDAEGGVDKKMPFHPVPWAMFTLQDAIDFSIFAVRSTIDAIRFFPRAKTVGGPIDILVIKRDGAAWIQRKELHG